MKRFLHRPTFLMVMLGLLAQSALLAEVSPAAKTEIYRKLEGILQLSPTDEVHYQAESYFRSLSLPEIVVAKDWLNTAKSCVERRIALVTMLDHWARLDGPAAYAYARSQTILGRTEAESRALIGWASYEPAKAWNELMVVSSLAADRRYAVISVLEQVANTNLDLALQFYKDLVPDRACLQCSADYLMVSAARTGSFDKVFKFMQGMPVGPSRDALRDGYWAYMGQYLPELGLVQLKEVLDPVDHRAAEVGFCTGWALTSFPDCLDYILHQAGAEKFAELILPSVSIWARFATHDDVVNLVKSLPPELAQRSLLGLANTLSSVDPKVTLDWVASFPYSEVRTNSLNRAISRWAKIDQKAAHDYIEKCADTETRGIMLWYFLFSKLDNQTLVFEELAEANDRYSKDWRVKLFAGLSARLADPSVNNGGKYDLKAFQAFVEQRRDFSEEEKSKILEPFAKQ